MFARIMSALRGELRHWKYYLAPYIGTGIYLVITNPRVHVIPVANWHVANAIGLVIGYLVTFGLRKYWFGSKDMRRAHTEFVQYSLWSAGSLLLSVAGVYVLVEYLACPELPAQIIMSAITSLMGRRVASAIFVGGFSRP